MPPLLEVKDLGLKQAGQSIISGLSFTVEQQQVVCLLGPSGCGKTTLLRALAGFHPITKGSICVKGQVLSHPEFVCAPQERKIGMVFQEQALFPHLTVMQNVEFGLSHLRQSEKRRRAQEYLNLIELGQMGKRYPHQLSGGQQQRVAIARALAPHPTLLLLDEPFSSLDSCLRASLRKELLRVLKEKAVTALLVTHDQEEAFAVADQIGVIHQGSCQQWDSPYNIYHEPSNRFVATFIGLGSFLAATVTADGALKTPVGVLQTTHPHVWAKGTQVDVLLRPDDVCPAPQSTLLATVIKKIFNGATTWYELLLPEGSQIKALFSSHYDYKPKQQIGIQIKAHHVVAFERNLSIDF